jgi:glyoxylase-like metal-dependent hydrolase (beta-lactamase superfamily II)
MLDLLVPGVYSWLQLPSGPGRANAGVVIDADGITLIDALLSPSQWTPLAEAVEALGPPVRRVVLTSSNAEY